jgi:hypothetical protein
MMTPEPISEDTPQEVAVNSDSIALITPKKYWRGNPILTVANVCDKFFNCAYVKKQLEEEWREESQKSHRPTGSSVENLFMRMDKGVEVEIYRQFLFEENGLEPFEDPSPPDRREATVDAKEKDTEKRTY